MQVEKAYQCRIYPTPEQQEFLSKQFGSVRFIYNHFLANRKSEYLNNKKPLNYYDDAKELAKLKQKDGYQWLYEINSQSLQAALRNLEVAYQNFFRKKAKLPRFHSRKHKQTIKIPQKFKIKGNKLFIPKLKTGIKIKLHRQLPKKIICVFITKTCANKYLASFLCQVEIKSLKPNHNKIGIDLGITSFVITSENQKFENKHFYQQQEAKLKYEQRQLSKKEKGSRNKEKQRLVVARINNKIANQRKNYLHQVSRQIINENQVIICETLKVKKMMQNSGVSLAKSTQDCSWGEFLRQLEYKAKWYGRTFHQIEHFFPSSKTCSQCQFVLDSLSLNIREWECPKCKFHHNRDLNAAINIRDKGLKNLSGLGINSDSKQKLGEALSSEGSMNQDTLT